MSELTIKTKQAVYAENYKDLIISGTLFLAFRDVPQLIKTYVKGNFALDYGCGVGNSTAFLKSLGLIIDGVDINEHMIKIAQERDQTLNLKVIKSGILPVNDNYYDLVFSSWVLQEVGNKEELLKIAQEISRVLKPSGTFIAVTSNKNSYNTDWLTYNTEFDINKNLQSGSRVKILFKQNNLEILDYFWSCEDYLEVLKNAGLTVVRTHEPLGKSSDNYPWVQETLISPHTIYVAKKFV